MKLVAPFLLVVWASALHAQAPLPIFDAHLHYSHDAWDVVPVEQAVAILRQAGVKRALVSSSDDEGNQRLFRAAPDIVIPELRPYRKRGEIGSWFRDSSVIPYLEKQLSRHKYAALGEYHIYGADVDLPVPRQMIQLARKYGLFLHSHSDADAIDRQFRQWPQARILWAHSGFERPEAVAAMLRKHKNLWCDLAFRTDQASGGKVDAAWRAAFMEFPDRFMVGTDSFTPERWHYVAGHAEYSRQWLADLPRDVAERIAWKNGETLFGSLLPGL
ncbi:MAG TPA: amidohydrolase family protein [Burkholderiales bacterium]|nr:amidohydrolase family protein [Burkholderiales bacterium]